VNNGDVTERWETAANIDSGLRAEPIYKWHAGYTAH
jgi:hypothetical protein